MSPIYIHNAALDHDIICPARCPYPRTLDNCSVSHKQVEKEPPDVKSSRSPKLHPRETTESFRQH